MNDTFVIAPILVAATMITVTAAAVIFGVYCARLILRLWTK